jgi:eukaryotic-like serine/threonine-protein kinase
MPATVILSVIAGSEAGREYEFTERAVCIVGRAEDCQPRLPQKGEESRLVSRHHCLFDINPPDIRVRDFGSLNGTYVNDEKIGSRLPGQSPEQGAQLEFRECDLGDGDHIRVGMTVFRVGVQVPVCCGRCGAEMPNANGSESPVCAECRVRATNQGAHKAGAGQRCSVCGRALPDIAGRRGEAVCASCQQDANRVALDLLRKAADGDPDLVPLRGYQLVTELARGDQNIVYLASNDNSEQIALKVLIPKIPVDLHAKEKFLRELTKMKGLNHPNIVAVRDCGASGPTFYVTSEYCAGGSIADVMHDRGHPFDPPTAVSIIKQVLAGLAYAHGVSFGAFSSQGSAGGRRGVVHRHITPHNILLPVAGNEGAVKLADFGLAKSFDAAGFSGQSMSGTGVTNVVAFMPRAQLINYRFTKPEVDVWACTASLYWMLTGLPPRDFPRGKDPITIVLQENPVPIQRRNGTIPLGLAAVIDMALKDDPIGITTAEEVAAALEVAL